MKQIIGDIDINKAWYYIIIQNPGMSEEFVGFTDEKTNEKFIPAFGTKDDAQKCFSLMPRDLFKEKYEVQAVIGEDILATADLQGHKVYLLDKNGSILQLLN